MVNKQNIQNDKALLKRLLYEDGKLVETPQERGTLERLLHEDGRDASIPLQKIVTIEGQRGIWLEEYKVIEDLHKHYDNINMGLMAFLVAGVFGVWGFVLQQSTIIKPTTTFLIEWITFIILSIWIQHMTIHRTIIVIKLSRARVIERLLGMRQNIDFEKVPRLRGQLLELVLYFTITFFGFVFSLFFQVGLNNSQITTISAIVNNIKSNWTALHVIRLVLSILPCILSVIWLARCRAQVANVIEGYKADPHFKWLLKLGGYKGK